MWDVERSNAFRDIVSGREPETELTCALLWVNTSNTMDEFVVLFYLFVFQIMTLAREGVHLLIYVIYFLSDRRTKRKKKEKRKKKGIGKYNYYQRHSHFLELFMNQMKFVFYSRVPSKLWHFKWSSLFCQYENWIRMNYSIDDRFSFSYDSWYNLNWTIHIRRTFVRFDILFKQWTLVNVLRGT